MEEPEAPPAATEIEAAGDSTGAAHAKATRADWLRRALDVLISDGIDAVKVLKLSRTLGVSRSSFYWYFGSRQDLLDALLAHWDATNTRAVIAHASAAQPSITAAVAHVFRAWVDPSLFDPRLDFAVREWSRRSGRVRRVLDRADAARLDALAAMFARHGYPPGEADARARVLYYMQIGYYALDLNEGLEDRLARVPDYLISFTGRAGSAEEIASLCAFARRIDAGRA